jgi:hypothetical protein
MTAGTEDGQGCAWAALCPHHDALVLTLSRQGLADLVLLRHIVWMQVLKMAKAVPGLRHAFQREWMLGPNFEVVPACFTAMILGMSAGAQDGQDTACAVHYSDHHQSVTSILVCHVEFGVQVLKMAKAVPGLRRAFQREWMLGRRLNAVAAQAPELNMIIHTGDQQHNNC